MSVFQLQEWWSVKVAEEEEFDLNCFDIGNVDNSVTLTNKIVVGSLKGVLRMYNPSRPNYRVEDLVMEENLEKPILQLAVGRFIPGSEILGVAVLHPRELVVYEVIPQAVKDDRVSYYSLKRIYKHDLGLDGKHFTAYNMTHGAFGGVRGRDMIMVQSMDGKLQIFEQSAHAFSVQLVDCLLPGPLIYVPKLDAFVTVNYAGIAECYRYQALASSSSTNRGESKLAEYKASSDHGATNAFGLRNVRSTLVEWSVNLGEPCKQILLGNFSPLEVLTEGNASSAARKAAVGNELLLICEKSLFLVKVDTGGIISQRRLERAEAACGCLVPTTMELPDGNGTVTHHNFLLVDLHATISVFGNFNLIWAAKHPTSTPVHISLSSFGGQQGLIVAIDEMGYLTVNYLGTKPPVTTVLTQMRDLDYDKIDEEHRQLLQIIRDSQNEQKGENQVERILIKSQVTRQFDTELMREYPMQSLPVSSLVSLHGGQSGGHVGTGHAGEYMKVAVRLFLTSTTDKPLQNVSLTIATPDHIRAVPHHITIPQVVGMKQSGSSGRSTPVVVKVYFYALKSYIPHAQDIVITASYASSRGEPLITPHYLTTPFYLSYRPKPPTKQALYKFVLDTDFAAVSLTELWSDVLYAYTQAGYEVTEMVGGNAIQAMGLQILHPALVEGSGSGGALTPIVSILVSKNAGRYRVQADAYPLLYNVLHELEKRLNAHLQPNAAAAAAAASDTATASTNTASGKAAIPLHSVVKWNDDLPLDDYFAAIAKHLSYRLKLVITYAQLNDVAQQYRLIEKRLLTRYKDRNPTPLHGLDILLKESYDKIITLSDEIGSVQKTIQGCTNDVLAFTKLMIFLISLKYQLSIAERTVLMNILCPDHIASSSQTELGWEEMMSSSLQYMIRLVSNKNSKDTMTMPMASSAGSSSGANGEFDVPKNIDALKKNFLILLDRLEKGAKIPLPK